LLSRRLLHDQQPAALRVQQAPFRSFPANDADANQGLGQVSGLCTNDK
jgi:hypothetical protein